MDQIIGRVIKIQSKMINR